MGDGAPLERVELRQALGLRDRPAIAIARVDMGNARRSATRSGIEIGVEQARARRELQLRPVALAHLEAGGAEARDERVDVEPDEVAALARNRGCNGRDRGRGRL